MLVGLKQVWQVFWIDEQLDDAGDPWLPPDELCPLQIPMPNASGLCRIICQPTHAAHFAEQFDVHPNQITTWKAQLKNGAAHVFDSGGGRAAEPVVDVKALHAKIGEAKMSKTRNATPLAQIVKAHAGAIGDEVLMRAGPVHLREPLGDQAVERPPRGTRRIGKSPRARATPAGRARRRISGTLASETL